MDILINALLIVLAVVGLVIISFFIEMRSEAKYYSNVIVELKQRIQAIEDKLRDK